MQFQKRSGPSPGDTSGAVLRACVAAFLCSLPLPAAESLGRTSGDFDLSFRPGLARPVELAFARKDDQNCYLLHLDGKECRLVRLLAGVEEPLASGPIPPGDAPLLLKRRAGALRLFADGKQVIRAYDQELREGEMLLLSGSLADKPELRSVKPFVFSDDFMRAEKGVIWQEASGSWELNSVRNPTRSVNALNYVGRSDKGLGISIAGDPHWDEYTATVRVKPGEKSTVGLAFYLKDAENYFALVWRPGVIALIRRLGRNETTLSTKPLEFVPDSWYELKVEVTGERIHAFVDDNRVLSARAPDLEGGRVALLVEGQAVFDDFDTRSNSFLQEEFDDWSWARALTVGGQWKVNGGCRLSTPGEAKLILGDGGYPEFKVTVDLGEPSGGAAGCVFNYHDEQNHHLARWFVESGNIELWQVIEGKKVLLGDGRVATTPGDHRLTVCVENGLIRVSLDGARTVGGWDTQLEGGKVGLYGTDTRVVFRRLRVDFGPSLTPVLTSTTVFAHEKTMSNWADPASDWRPEPDRETFWHRLRFFGDLQASVAVPRSQPAGSRLGLMIGDGVSALYRLELALQQLSLYRRGQLVESRTLPVVPENLFLARVGDLVVGGVEDGPVLGTRDEAAAYARCLGYYGKGGVTLDPEGLGVTASNVEAYTFDKAPSEWRLAGGQWEVSNRWACDPRWSWYCGRKKDGLAAIWAKRGFSGDMVVDFCVGVRMEPAWGDGYGYVRDLDLTLAADGKDIVTGYSFLLGGWGNTASGILKGKATVAKTDKLSIDRGQLHRRWYYIKVVKTGARVEYWVDDSLVASYDDPEPLTGDKIAIWTWDDSMMVARVRVCAERISECERPVVHETCAAPYE